MAEPLEPVVVDSNQGPPANSQVDSIVKNIVARWNEIVRNLENTTIKLCLMVNDLLKDYPDGTVKEVLERVKKHPDIKRFVSIDRIWQGMRLVKARPELIRYHLMEPDQRDTVVEDDKPYLKKDGEIFWEFYFEIEKHPLPQNTRMMIEMEGKKEKWSFRDLKQKIQETKDEREHPMGFEARGKEKQELISKIISLCRTLPVENLRGIYNMCFEFKQDLEKEKKEGGNNGQENKS